MNSGFVIFRDPGKADEIQGWRGEFGNISQVEISESPVFYLQPWSKSQAVSALKVSEKISDPNELKLWISECHFQNEFENLELKQLEFEQFVAFSKTAIAQGDMSKIVAVRNRIQKKENIDIWQCFENLCHTYSNAYISIISHPEFGTWIGASPELFLNWENGMAETVALAGTLVRSQDSWTSKEKNEQGTIAEFLHELFQKFGIKNYFEAEKTEVKQGELTHIAQNFRFSLDKNSIGTFLNELHPTPAVGGYSQESAIGFIERFEKINRDLFTGWMGWSDENKLHSWVNLRCAKINAEEIQFFAGCGINDGSDAQKEWEEAEAKMNILGKFL